MSTSPRILYIDDEEELLQLVATFFEFEDLAIDTSSTLEVALDKIKRQSYDLIISDRRLSDGDGKDFCSLIKKEKLFVGKFILLTGDMEVYGEILEDTFDLVLYKPIQFEQLLLEVQKMLAVELK